MLVGDLIPRNAYLRAADTAVVFDGGSCTYGEYAERTYRLGNALIGLGLQRQDRISILSQNSIECLEVFGAGEVTGIIVHPVNFRLTAPEVEYVLGDAAPSVVFFQAQYADLIASIRASLPGIRHFVEIGGEAAQGPAWSPSSPATAASPTRLWAKPSRPSPEAPR